jgi:hypothetical protein
MLGWERFIRCSRPEAYIVTLCKCLDYQSILMLVTEIETVDIQLRVFPVLRSSTVAMRLNEQGCHDSYDIVKD